MAYSTPPTVSDGDDISAAWWNTNVKANFEAGIPDIFQAEGDIAFATGSKAAGMPRGVVFAV